MFKVAAVTGAAGVAVALNPAPASSIKTGLGAEVDAIAAKSPSLQADLAKLKTDKWSVTYGPENGGSYVNRNSNPKSIVIDGALKNRPKEATQALAHEAGHAMYPYQPDMSSKDKFVNGTLADEGAATMNNIKVQREIIGHDKTDIGIAGNAANHPAYNAAYEKYLKSGNAAEARSEIGNIFGSKETTSTTGEAYSEYYGSWYDKNKK